MWKYSYALSVGRGWGGNHNYIYKQYTAIFITNLLVTGEQLLLLARGGRGCDGMWEAEGETGTSQ